MKPEKYNCPVCKKETAHYEFPIYFGGYEIMICSDCKVMTCNEKEI